MICTYIRAVLISECWFGLSLAFYVFFWFSLDYFVLVLFAFVVLDLISSISTSQGIGCEEHLRIDVFYVEWDMKLKY